MAAPAETSGTAVEQAQQSRTIQAALSASLAREVARLWPNLDRKRLDASFPSWLELMIALVDRYHGMSALAASVYYRDVREQQTGLATPDRLLDLPATPSRDWLARAFGYSGPGLLRDGAWQDSSALSTTQGTAVRAAQTGGRDMILSAVRADPKASGWYRVTDGRPCAFCALLASRGAIAKTSKPGIYKSRETAGFKAHNDCGCTAAPYFGVAHMPEVNHKAAEIYRNRGSGPALAAFRKAWNQHLADTAEPLAPAA